MLKKVTARMVSVAIAFLVFGIIDNGIMVTVGSSIDATLGQMFSISTMASAGFGNTFSDMVGIILGRYTEKTVHRIIPHDDTFQISKTKIVVAESVGIVIGCLIGMSPLLLF